MVILALPDRVLGRVAREVVPRLRPGALVITLDPAAAHAGELPAAAGHQLLRHPPLPPERVRVRGGPGGAGGFLRRHQGAHADRLRADAGPGGDYALGEQLARDFFAPVTRAHRITVEQMALLEPAMAETVGIALIVALREALEEVVRRGVPRAAAEDFLYGHIKVPLGIAFERVDFPFSDGAKLIAEFGRQRDAAPDWKQVFEPESVREQVRAIVDGQLPDE